ncbi:MAG: hypothetical protein KAH97_07910 [Anaerolineales bacterium]|nr:hypothetical protein [Anaerolineales bacterium]
MDQLQGKRANAQISPPKQAVTTRLETSERLIRIFIMSAFISVLAFEAWLLSQVWQLF